MKDFSRMEFLLSLPTIFELPKAGHRGERVWNGEVHQLGQEREVEMEEI